MTRRVRIPPKRRRIPRGGSLPPVDPTVRQMLDDLAFRRRLIVQLQEENEKLRARVRSTLVRMRIEGEKP